MVTLHAWVGVCTYRRYNNSALLQRVMAPALRWMRFRFAVLLRLGNKLMQLGSGIVWPMCVLLMRLLHPAISMGRVAIVAVAGPLSHVFSAAGGAHHAADVVQRATAVGRSAPGGARALASSTGSAARVAGTLINSAGGATTATVKKAVSWSNTAQKAMRSTAKTRKTLQSIAAGASDVIAVMSVSQVHDQNQAAVAENLSAVTASPEHETDEEDEEDEEGDVPFQTPSEGESSESDGSD